jgi:hypothetical protein
MVWGAAADRWISRNATIIEGGVAYSFAFHATSNKHNYKEQTAISIAHRNTLPPELRAKVDEIAF